ncbi:MAG: archease [Candidatus Bathyarchaeota archaeon]|nr:MAG: archease [Candidatus Bathyarchaeota archaeon]
MDRKGKFEFLEHTADVYIAAHGTTLKEAYENAALAMFEVITDTDKVSPNDEDSVKVKAEDEYALLYSWLEALLVKLETTNMLYSKFKISNLEETSDGFRIKATAWGEKFNAEKHTQKVAVKAITYHRMKIIKEIGKVTLEFILDI